MGDIFYDKDHTSSGIIGWTRYEYQYIGVGYYSLLTSTGDDVLISEYRGAEIEVYGIVDSYADDGLDLRNIYGPAGDFLVYIDYTGIVSGTDAAVEMHDDFNLLDNYGEIIGDETGIANYGDLADIYNWYDGTITSLYGNAVLLDGEDNWLYNRGLIESLSSSHDAHAVEFSGGANWGSGLTNRGTIVANGGDAVHGDDAAHDTLYNYGTIDGDVSLGGLGDWVKNDGVITGSVYLGAGWDTFKGWSGEVDGTIHGEGGNDFITGGISNDRIFGDWGEDELRGGGGNDMLNGGYGRDTLIGNAGFDTFVFSRVADSPANSTRDQINDFTPGKDLINVSPIDADWSMPGNEAYNYIGAAAFSGTPGELRWEDLAAGTLVVADNNGDGVGEFSVFVNNVHGLTVGDFIL